MQFPMPLPVMRASCEACGDLITVSTDAERAICPTPCERPVRIHEEEIAFFPITE